MFTQFIEIIYISVGVIFILGIGVGTFACGVDRIIEVYKQRKFEYSQFRNVDSLEQIINNIGSIPLCSTLGLMKDQINKRGWFFSTEIIDSINHWYNKED